jgi:hypothetical protein
MNVKETLDALAARLQTTGVRTVFGEPVSAEGRTIIAGWSRSLRREPGFCDSTTGSRGRGTARRLRHGRSAVETASTLSDVA